MATSKQIKIIHMLKNIIGISDEEYRAKIRELTNGFCESSKELSNEVASKFIDELKNIAIKQSVWKKYGTEYLSEMDGREGYASAKQLRMIEAMYAEKFKGPRKLREKALRKFVKRIVGVDDLRWLRSEDVKKVIKAIESLVGYRWNG